MNRFSLPVWAVCWLICLVSAIVLRPPLPVDETRYLAVAWEMWLRERAGHATASCFADILATGRNGQPLKAREDYLMRLVVERITGEPVESPSRHSSTPSATLENSEKFVPEPS